MSVPNSHLILSREYLQSILRYDPETGVWTRIEARGGARIGDVAGNPDSGGYTQITIDGVIYMAHRLAWFYMTGEWPPRRIDHEDTDQANNRWVNLRLATRRQNAANAKVSKANRLGVKGVTRVKSKSLPFRARIYVNKRLVTIGYYATPEEANAAYFKRAQQAHGEFARAG